MITMTKQLSLRFGVAAVLCGLLAGCGEGKSPAPPMPERTFATAEEAVTALVAAAAHLAGAVLTTFAGIATVLWLRHPN